MNSKQDAIPSGRLRGIFFFVIRLRLWRFAPIAGPNNKKSILTERENAFCFIPSSYKQALA